MKPGGSWLPALALALVLLGPGCGEFPLPGVPPLADADPAADYYPFATRGYVLHWEVESTIRVVVPDCPSAAVGCTGNGFETAVREGIVVWNPVHALLGIRVQFVPDLTPNEVRVVWDDGTGSSGYGIAPGVIGFAGIATPPADPSRFIVMTTRCNICPGLPSHTNQDIFLITVHEWGHMLGVWNHSFDPADLMYPYYQGNALITNRDVSTMFKSYSMAPALDLTRLPPNSLTAAPGAGGGVSFAPADLLIRFLHSYGEPPTTTLEFNPQKL